MRYWGLVAAIVCGGCDMDFGVDDNLPDFAFPYDMTVVAPDLTVPMCPLQFTGFAGVSDVERRADCGCGCSIDTLLGNMVGGFWATPISSPAGHVVPTQGVGLQIDLDATTTQETAGIISTPTVAPFYLDGNFTVAVDYSLVSFANDARVEMILTSQFRSYGVDRARTAPGENVATAKFSGVAPTTRIDSSTTGTLQIQRDGATVIATVNGVPISQIINAGSERLTLYLGAARGPCTAADGGACGVSVVIKNVRMMGGALVDRR